MLVLVTSSNKEQPNAQQVAAHYCCGGQSLWVHQVRSRFWGLGVMWWVGATNTRVG